MKLLLGIKEIKDSLWPEWLKDTFSDNLLSCFLHGDCLMQGFTPMNTPWLVSFILRKNDPAHLAELQPLVKKAKENGIAFGYFFTKESIAASQDTFPLEFLHISQKHELIAGEEPLAGYVPDKKALRLECERELRGLLVHLRRNFVYMQQGHTKLEFFLSADAHSMPVLYGAEYLLKGVYPQGREDIYTAYPDLRVEPPVGDEKIILDRAERYMNAIERITEIIDTLEV